MTRSLNRMPRYSRIVGTGSFLPSGRVTNEELVATMAAQGIDSSNEWIVERTGIRARHFAAPNVSSSMLGAEACRRALAAAGLMSSDIDLIICATSTPDHIFPSTACLIQAAIGASTCAALDVQAVCTGFIYALTVADAMIRGGGFNRALVVGAEVFSRLLDFKDRTTCVLFGDGAGAVVLAASSEPGIVASRLHADGHHAHILSVPGNVSGGRIVGEAFLRMDGPAVFKIAVNMLEAAAQQVLDDANRQASDINWLIPHQANLRIMHGAARKLGLPPDRMVVTVDQHGNTSAASIPLALDHAVRAGQVRPGHTLLLEGVGGGMTWGAVLIDY